MNKPEYIIMHHTLTNDGKVVDSTAIRRYHMGYAFEGKTITQDHAVSLMARGIKVKKPWKDIGYHFIIELSGYEYVSLMGRMPNTNGAHCLGMNHRSIGVALVGNFDKTKPAHGQILLAAKVVNWLVGVYGIAIQNIKGHRDFADKSCPGSLFDMDEFRYCVEEL